jgi:hypothetical protein
MRQPLSFSIAGSGGFHSVAAHRAARYFLGRCDKAISPTRQGLDEAWGYGRVSQCIAKSFYSRIQPNIEIHKRLRWPKPLTKLFASHHGAGTPQQQYEDLKRLVLKFDPQAVLAQFARPQIGLECAEANFLTSGGFFQGISPVFPGVYHSRACKTLPAVRELLY